MTEAAQEGIEEATIAVATESPITEQEETKQTVIPKVSIGHAIMGSTDIPINNGMLMIAYLADKNIIQIQTGVAEEECNWVGVQLAMLEYAPVVISFGYHVVTIGRPPFMQNDDKENFHLSDSALFNDGNRRSNDQLLHPNDRVNIKL
jgi:hypothetical protein